MHILTIPEGISEPLPVLGGAPMLGGHDYLCTNAFAGSLMQSSWRVEIENEPWALRALIKVSHWPEAEFDLSRDWNNENIWLIRGGGYGDLLMLTPLIRELRARWPHCIIHVAAGGHYKGLFIGLNVIEEDIPIDVVGLDYGSAIISFEERIEGHPEAEKYHIAQQFANKLGIDLKGDHRPSYTVTADEKEWQVENYPHTKKRIGVQYFASALYRSYPKTGQVINLLLKEGVEVMLFGRPGQLGSTAKAPDDLVNLTAANLTFRQSAAVLASCDCVLAPDSAMVHLASALDIPCVGLYGPIPPKLRGSGNKMRGLMGTASCSPCFFHAERPEQFPANMPCSEKGICVALESIKPELIAEEVMNMASPIIRLDGRRVE